MRIPTASATAPANAETHNARNPLRPTMGRNRTPKTPKTQTNHGGKQTMPLNPQIPKIPNHNNITTKQRTTTSFKSTRKTAKRRTVEPPDPALWRVRHDERKTDNAKPTTTKNTKNKPYLQRYTPEERLHKTERGTHIKWEKLAVNRNQTKPIRR